MKLDIVLITTGSRPRLLEQSLRSLRENASNWDQHSLTLVMDGCSVMGTCGLADTIPDRVIWNTAQQGASRSRNIGASSTPKYLRQDAVCFFDDDVYCCKGWDAFNYGTDAVWSGHAHPYNHPFDVVASIIPAQQTSVLSTVHMIIPWVIWDCVGWFSEPGGPGGSEDVAWCKHATDMGYALGVSIPQSVIHCGIGSTAGHKLIGWEQVMENNRKLEKIHGVEGRVVYG